MISDVRLRVPYVYQKVRTLLFQEIYVRFASITDKYMDIYIYMLIRACGFRSWKVGSLFKSHRKDLKKAERH